MPLLLALFLSTQTSCVVDPEARRGVWEGWGTSLCWMGKVFGDRNDLADLLFTTKTVEIAGERLPGLGMNVVRYNAGACSWNAIGGRRMVVSKTILPYRQMEGFWHDGKNEDPDSKSWDWSVDRAQRTMLLKAKARGADRFELFSNAPMWWMCANDNPSGAANPSVDNLDEGHRGRFAVYLATIARRARERWGVSFTTIEPFNEPFSRWWNENGKQEGCHFSPGSQAALLPLLRSELDRRGLRDLRIAASDETSITQAIQTWSAFGAATRASIAQVNVHGYEGDASPRAQLRESIDDKPLWLSEHGEDDATGLSLAHAIALDLHGLRPRAWCYWQPFDGGGWGFLDADLRKARILRTNPKLFVMAQYSRHIRPGMTIVETGDPDVVAAYDPNRRRLAIVVTNEGAPSRKRFDLSRFRRADGSSVRWTTEPKASARYVRSTGSRLIGKDLTIDLPADSIQTIEIDRVQ